MSAVFQYETGLLFIKRNIILFLIISIIFMISETLDMFSRNYCFFNNFLTVRQLYFCVKPTLRLDTNQRSHFTEAMAAAFFHSNGITMRFFRKFYGTRDIVFFH
jgi:hypothetical protein